MQNVELHASNALHQCIVYSFHWLGNYIIISLYYCLNFCLNLLSSIHLWCLLIFCVLIPLNTNRYYLHNEFLVALNFWIFSLNQIDGIMICYLAILPGTIVQASNLTIGFCFLIFEKKMWFPFKDCFWEKKFCCFCIIYNYNEGFFHHLLNCMKKYSHYFVVTLEAVEGGRLGS